MPSEQERQDWHRRMRELQVRLANLRPPITHEAVEECAEEFDRLLDEVDGWNA